jgi:hypothetical protein
MLARFIRLLCMRQNLQLPVLSQITRSPSSHWMASITSTWHRAHPANKKPRLKQGLKKGFA